MTTFKKLLVSAFFLGFATLNVGFLGAARFDNAIQEATQPIQQHLEGAGFAGAQGWAEWARDILITVVQKVIVPIIVIVGVLMSIIGFYEIMTSDKEEDQKKGFQYVLWWVVGIIVMLSASFIANRLVGSGGVLDFVQQFQGNVAAWKLYSLIIFPFLKMIMFIVIGILFLVLILHMYRFLMNPDDKIKQNARTIIIWNAIGILTILFAKAIVETIYGRQEDVINPNATSLADIGTGVLADKSFSWLYVVLNWVMGLVGFVVVVLIIVEAVNLLRNPTDEKQIEKIKKSFLYIVIGIVIIGVSYAITNFVVLQ